MVLGLAVSKHFKIYMPNLAGVEPGKWNGQDDHEADRNEIERAYTPTTGNEELGYVDLVVKVYRAGQVARFPAEEDRRPTLASRARVSSSPLELSISRLEPADDEATVVSLDMSPALGTLHRGGGSAADARVSSSRLELASRARASPRLELARARVSSLPTTRRRC
jgi:hypothetical protein